MLNYDGSTCNLLLHDIVSKMQLMSLCLSLFVDLNLVTSPNYAQLRWFNLQKALHKQCATLYLSCDSHNNSIYK
jgi:hypothetical protein